MDVSQYLEIFIDETKEHLESLSEQILSLEKDPNDKDTINEIFRAAHSLKGMAGTMGFKRMQRLTHDMEDVFSEIRNDKMNVSAELIDILFKGLDALEDYLATIQETADEGTKTNDDIIEALNKFLKNEGVVEQETKSEDSSANVVDIKSEDSSTKTECSLKLEEHEINAINSAINSGFDVYEIKVSVEETCVLKAARAFLVFKALEELGQILKSVPLVNEIEEEKFDHEFTVVFMTEESIDKVISEIKNVSEIKDATFVQLDIIEEPEEVVKEEKIEEVKKETPKKEDSKASSKKTEDNKSGQKHVVSKTIRVDIEKLDVLMNLVSELIIAKNGLVSLSGAESKGTDSASVHEQIEYLERVTTNLHESVMKVRMVPIESVVNRFPRMIRDTSKKLNKKMQLTMSGEETELDRTVIDEIGDPLMHLLRNSADHGIEANDVRVANGKPEIGNISLNAFQDGNNVIIEVKDDGGGINTEKVLNSAIEKGVVTEEEGASMTDKEIIDLLFRPSFSTAKEVTDISGRGVGLDVVKSKIEGLGGDIEVKSVLGEGSTFTIRLPLTLAIIQALMIELADEKYAIPLGNIQTIEDISVDEIKYVQAKEVIYLRGIVIPIIRLDSVLDIPDRDEVSDRLTVVIVSKGNNLAGIVVDKLIGQQEIVIKSIGKYIHNHKVIGGATILGDGEVALILDVNALV